MPAMLDQTNDADPLGWYLLAAELLDCAKTRLASTVAGAPAFACVVNGDVAWDACCDGQLWVRPIRAYPTAEFPLPIDATKYRCQLELQVALVLEVGILRCAPTVKSGARVPTCAELEASAQVVYADAKALYEGVTCCGGYTGSFIVGDIVWLGPEGGCVGSSLTVTLETGACCS